MSETLPEPDPTLSLDATDSTYEAAPEDTETKPSPGPATIQTLGQPGDGASAPKKSTRSSSSSSSGSS